MRNILKKLNKIKPIRKLYLIIPTRLYLMLAYQMITGKKLRINPPQTLNEKIQWKKIYDRNLIYTLCADKYAVRKYIENKIGKKYLIPLLYHTKMAKSINLSNIKPPFIIKPNNASGQIIIIKNKKEIVKKDIINKCEEWLNSNFYFDTREWQYKKIIPEILIERLLLTKEGNIPNDYKFHCFNGIVEFIQVDTDRFTDHKRGMFDLNWKSKPFTWAPRKNNLPKYKIIKIARKPKNLRKMIKIAEILSKDFDYVRVDLYSANNRIYFGELSFTPASGFESFFPDKYDLFYGKKLRLSVVKK